MLKDDNQEQKISVIDYTIMQENVDYNEKQRIEKLYKGENKRKHSNLFYVGIVYFFILLLVIGVRIISNLGFFDSFTGLKQEYISSSLIQIVIMFSVPLLLFCLIKKQGLKSTFKDFKYKKISGKIITISIVIGVLVFLLNGFIASIFSFIINLLGFEASPVQLTDNAENGGLTAFYVFSLIFCSCILPAICEETAHRGMLLNTLKRYGVTKAIIISGIMFGLIHLNINQFFYTAIIGCFLAFLTIISDSIYPAMIVHFMNNFLSTIGELLNSAGYDSFSLNGILNFANSIFGTVLSNFILFLVLVFSALLIVYLCFVIYKKQKYSEILLKIQKKNVAYFYRFENLDENGIIKQSAIDKFFNAPSPQLASLLYLSQRQGEKFMNNFEDVYSKDKGMFLNWSFIISAICLGAIVTIFTFVWGTL